MIRISSKVFKYNEKSKTKIYSSIFSISLKKNIKTQKFPLNPDFFPI